MMDALTSDTLHSSEPMHSFPCINTHTDELSKEKEEELLYGIGDDADEEDVLSDDSMRLRLSDDDEIEVNDVSTPALEDQGSKPKNNETEMLSGKAEDMQTSPVPAAEIVKNNTSSTELKQEEHCSGNVSMDEKAIFEKTRLMRQQTSNMLRPLLNYEPQWRFSRSSGARPFRGLNHSSYNRSRYLSPRNHFRHQSYEYNVRFNNAFLPFERGRGNGMFNSYNRSVYGNRQSKRGLKSPTVQKQNSSVELNKKVSFTPNASMPAKIEVNNSIKNGNLNDDIAIEEDDVLNNKFIINNNKRNDVPNILLNEKIKNNAIEDSNAKTCTSADSSSHAIKLQPNSEESTEIKISNDEIRRNITVTRISVSDNNFNEDSVNSLINSDDNKQTKKTHKGDINNTNFDSRDFIFSDNSEKVEALSIGINCEDEDRNTNGKNSKNNETEAEIDLTTDRNVNKGGGNIIISDVESESVETNYEIKLPASNCKILGSNTRLNDITVQDELIVNGDVPDCRIEATIESKKGIVSLQSTNSDEHLGDNSLKDNCVIQNNLITIEDTSIKSVVKSEHCNSNQLNVSDGSIAKSSKPIVSKDQLVQKIDLQEQSKDVVEKNVKLAERGTSLLSSSKTTTNLNENIETTLNNENNSSKVKAQLDSLTDIKDNSDDKDKKVNEVSIATQRRRKRTKKMIAAAHEAATEEDKQVRESGRQKRRTAKNAEEIIRKKFLNHDSDLESSDSSEKFVAVNYKMNQDACPLSPPSLKRNCPDTDSATLNGAVKKVKANSEASPNNGTITENNPETVKKLNFIHKFFQRDLNEKLSKLKQDELEELLIQKIVETITMRDEIGRLREQARISERNQEITRAKCQQLAKQIKDFEMVLSRNAADRRANNDKPTPPIKINRSVGLQVNFVTDHGMQNLRQLQQNSSIKPLHIANNALTVNSSTNETGNTMNPRRSIKVRSPRRSEPPGGQAPVVSQSLTQPSNLMPTITPAALVVAKPVDAQHSLTISNQPNVQPIMPNQQQSQQAIVLNGKLPNQINRPGATTISVAKSRANDLIDLTDEEEKCKVTSVPVTTATISNDQQTQKTQPCFQRVIQSIPGNVAITSQPPSIRVVQPASQPTPTALVNNMNAPRLAYVMQSGVGPTRQLLITPTSNSMRPVTSCRASFSTLAYKTGISTIANGTVRVLTTPASSNVQLNKHPAPLPDTRNYAVNPLWKLPPPAPSLKISKVANGIILSWNMNLSDKYADIASYQLYAYQEIAGVPPNTSLWKKVGDVRALPLPMACTLTQFSEGNNYYFAVRAVDTHSRKGQYSIPGNISL